MRLGAMTDHWSKSLGAWPDERPDAINVVVEPGTGIVYITTMGGIRLLGVPIATMRRAIERPAATDTVATYRGGR